MRPGPTFCMYAMLIVSVLGLPTLIDQVLPILSIWLLATDFARPADADRLVGVNGTRAVLMEQ